MSLLDEEPLAPSFGSVIIIQCFQLAFLKPIAVPFFFKKKNLMLLLVH